MPELSPLYRMSVFVYQAVVQYRSGKPELPKGYKRIAVLESRESRRLGYIAESASTIVIAFRGSEDWDDLKKNIAATQIAYPFRQDGGHTHKGFTELYGSLRPAVIHTLRHLPPAKKLVIAGHSLGGALASLCALDPAVSGKRRTVKLVTFGTPRIGDSVFAAALKRNTTSNIRVYRSGDLVPNVPPRNFLGFMYTHAGAGFGLANPTGSPVGSHSIAAYSASLGQLVPETARKLCRQRPGLCPASSSISNIDQTHLLL